jgi:peptide chain release factor 2
MGASDFWNNQEQAAKTVDALKKLRAILDPVENLEKRFEDAEVMVELASEDSAAADEARQLIEVAQQTLDKLELNLMLSGEHDYRNAYLSLQAGAGGTESCDWAEMLLRMYVRWCERSGFQLEMIDEQKNDEAGIKSATLLVKGQFAYGYLKAEAGVHRLVRISPFDAQARRQTSFASVDVIPEFDEEIEVSIRSEDLRVDTYRAGGAGGQHVNKTDSAIRLTHLPTGIVVACQAERSQHKNRATAMKMLAAKLYARAEAEREAKVKGIQGDKTEIGWGRQIRNYVLQPYKLVKDARTGVEKGNADAVLNGDLDDFIFGYLRMARGGTESGGKGK